MASVSWSVVHQLGRYITSSDTWLDTTAPSISEINIMGVIFNISDNQTLQSATFGSTTRFVDPPILSDMALTANFSPLGGLFLPYLVDAFLINELDPGDFSSGDGPAQRETLSLGDDFTVATEEAGYASATLTFSTAADTTIRSLIGSVHWSGKLAIGLEIGSNGGTLLPVDSPVLSMTQTNFFSGLQGGEGRVRAVRDSRYAMGAFSNELVEDGEEPGFWVREHDRDPDQGDENEYKPSPEEGSVHDRIPDI